MSDQALGSADLGDGADAAPRAKSLQDIFWMVLQPVLVLGSAFLVATMVTGEWMNHKLYALVMVMLPVPLLIVAERVWGKRKDWQLEPKELAEDGFWLAFGAFLWGPLISDFYRTPISEGFRAIRDTIGSWLGHGFGRYWPRYRRRICGWKSV